MNVENFSQKRNTQVGFSLQCSAWRDGQAGQRASAPARCISGRARVTPARRGQTPEHTAGVATAGARHRQVADEIYRQKEVGG
jgi:hypothetical protein